MVTAAQLWIYEKSLNCKLKGYTQVNYVCMHAKSLQSCPTLCNPMDLAPQAPLSVGFPRQENWSGLPFLPPGDLSNPSIKPTSPEVPALQVDFLPLSHQRSPKCCLSLMTECLPAKTLQACLTLCNSIDCSPPGFSVHGRENPMDSCCHALLQVIFPTQGWTHVSYVSYMSMHVFYRYLTWEASRCVCVYIYKYKTCIISQSY